MVRIIVDDENNGEEFWNWIQNNPEKTPEKIRELLDVDEVEVSPDELPAILAFLETVPGWDEGPEYAPNPLIIH